MGDSKEYVWGLLTKRERNFIKILVDNGFGVSTIRLYRNSGELVIWRK